MNISTRIKEQRTAHEWSQEQLAEKLGVSRQAITKWESGAGMPDVENLAALSLLFGVTVDELMFGADAGAAADGEKYQSITSVDLGSERRFDIHVGCAHMVTLRSCDGEKVVVRLESDGISDLERAFKVGLDTEGRSFDVDVASTGVVADALARKELDVMIELPRAYMDDAEVELSADDLYVEDATLNLEVGGKVSRVWLTNVEGHIELDISTDMEIWANDVRGRIDVNQVSATSVLHVPEDAAFTAATRGRLGKRTLRYTHDGEPAEPPATAEAPLAIELAGARVELTIDSCSSISKG